MPVLYDKQSGKYRIGSGKAIYDSKEKAERAYRGYLGAKYANKIQGGNMIDTKLGFFVPISKVDEEQRMVYGIATCETLDKQNEIVDYAATKDALGDYSNWRNIREMHKPSAVGTAPILELRDNDKSLYIGAKIVDEQAWLKCKEGVYKGFSIGGEVLDRRMEVNKSTGKPINRVTKYVMNEISIVDRPANPSCRFETVKRDTSIETITIVEDPLKEESARVMEKAITLAKKILSKDELEQLGDESFGLIKIVSDGDKLVKHRQYPMPDKVHAINMIRKMAGADELAVMDKERIHQTGLLVLGKSHNDMECPYCISQKLKGGVEVGKDIEKTVTVTHEPDKKTVEVTDEKPVGAVAEKPAVAEVPVEEKPVVSAAPAAEVPVEEKAPEVKVDEEVAAAPADPINAKLDSILALLQDLLGTEQQEMVEEKPEAVSTYDEEAPVVVEEAKEEVAPVAAEAKAGVPEAKACEEDECSKAVKSADVKKSVQVGLLKKIKDIVTPLAKENAMLKEKIAKLEKAPLPRKDALSTADAKPVKVEKYQDVKLEKKDSVLSEELTKDVAKANDLRKCGRTLTKEEDSFCQRVVERMIAEKLSK